MTDCRKLVYVVDDEPTMLQILEDIVTALGHDVASFGDGSDVLESEWSPRPDCILTDLRMPGVDGMTLFDTIQADDPSLPFVFVTGDALGLDTREFLGRAGRPFLYKPFRLEDLVRLLAAALGGEATWPPATSPD